MRTDKEQDEINSICKQSRLVMSIRNMCSYLPEDEPELPMILTLLTTMNRRITKRKRYLCLPVSMRNNKRFI